MPAGLRYDSVTSPTGAAGAIGCTYQSGLLPGDGGGSASISAFDYTGIYGDDRFYHDQWFHFAVRDRMARTKGNTDYHMMWRGGASVLALYGARTPVNAALSIAGERQSSDELVKWVGAYKADVSNTPQRW